MTGCVPTVYSSSRVPRPDRVGAEISAPGEHNARAEIRAVAEGAVQAFDACDAAGIVGKARACRASSPAAALGGQPMRALLSRDRVACTVSRAVLATMRLSFVTVTKRKPMATMRAA